MSSTPFATQLGAPGFLNVKVEQLRVNRVPIVGDGSITYNLGDNLVWDPNNHVAKPVGANSAGSLTQGLLYIGVCLDQQPINSIKQNLPFNQLNVMVKGLAQFTVDDNATYFPGDSVTFGAGSQLIRHGSNSNGAQIGVVAPENNFVVTAGATVGIVAVALVTTLLIYIKPSFTQLTSW